MQSVLIFFLILILPFKKLSAQGYEVEINTGISSYFGDLHPFKHATFQHARAYFTGSIKYGFNANLYMRTSITIASVHGEDNSIFANNQNLNFSSNIQEINTGLEYRLIGLEKVKVIPYVFACIGVFHFDPTTIYHGEIVHLQPLGTEGQGLPQYPLKKMYSLVQICIPFGGGFKMKINEDINIGIEFGVRRLFTDYLDDVSGTFADQEILLAGRGKTVVNLAYRGTKNPYPSAGDPRGDPDANDWYTFLGFTLGIKMFESNTGQLSLGGLIKTKHYSY